MSTLLSTMCTQIDQALQKKRRIIVALAGAPASGKSTLAEALNVHYGARSVIVPMDGFHYDNAYLDQHNLRARKGAPETFDVVGFTQLIRRIHHGEATLVPSFDRTQDCVVKDTIAIDDQALMIVEGNYLLLNQPLWHELVAYWDLAFFLSVPIAEIERRCIARWLTHGYTLQQATAKAQQNDVRNAQLVNDRRISQQECAYTVLEATKNGASLPRSNTTPVPGTSGAIVR